MYTITELSHLTGKPYMTVKNQMIRGYCPWPERKINGNTKNNAYKCWENMIQRCTNPDATGYKNYGGRNIKLNPEFLSFDKFIQHIGPRPSKCHSINRINNNGNYEPGNVEWATASEQAANTRCHKRGGTGIDKHGTKYRFIYQGKHQIYHSWEEAAEAKDNIYGKGYW